MAFQGIDFYDIDSLLSEEERAVRDTVRRWVDEAVMPIIGEHYIEGRFPLGLVPQMAELGLFGANLPAEYECAELNNVAYGLIMQELGVRQRGPKEALVAEDGARRGHRLLRADGAGLRFQSGGVDHHRPQGR
jgi:alkylation response protein AidB-like acyl-CoA dehydrogenase